MNASTPRTTRVEGKLAMPLRVHHRALADRLGPFLEAGVLSPGDIAVLDHAAHRFDLLEDPDIVLALACALAAPRRGHVGADLLALPDQIQADREHWRTDQELPALPWPVDLQAWQAKVSGYTRVVDRQQPRPSRPFVFQRTGRDASGRERGILLTNRMWREQRRLADALLGMARSSGDRFFRVDPATVADHLDALYPAGPGSAQARAAAECVLTNRLAVITGGPGTGKTWGVKRVLAVLLQAAKAAGRPLAIELAAPTGKAAVRMGEAMDEVDSTLRIAPDILAAISARQPRTVHKLLGVLPHKPHAFRHGKSQRLAADVVVVDEASMVDLVMMRHLVEAIADGSRLILLGDRDQLASVGAGTVLADLVSGVFDGVAGPLADCVVRLEHSFRFDDAARVACVADALQKRGAMLDDAAALLCHRNLRLDDRRDWADKLAEDPAERRRGSKGRIQWLNPRDQFDLLQPDIIDTVLQTIATGYVDAKVNNLRRQPKNKAWLRGPQPGYAALLADELGPEGQRRRLREPAFHAELLDALASYRVLTAHRRGPRGVSGLNKWLADHIKALLTDADKERRLADLDERIQAASGETRRSLEARRDAVTGKLNEKGGHWLGQPIIITRNDYDVGLRNGDVGLVVLRTGNNGHDELAAAFPVNASSDHDRKLPRYIPLARLPVHDTALAMTVHKSQGSQFDAVALVLPDKSGSPILTRELVYTAITRAKWRILWTGSSDVLIDAIGKDVDRASGLGPLLWNPGHGPRTR